MTRTIVRERIPARDPRLKRNINHDSESRRFAFPTAGLPLVSATHTRRIPVLNQGNLGSCVPNAGEGYLGTDPLFVTVDGRWPWTEDTAVGWYSEVTAMDPYPGGWYAPEWQDTGSDGLSLAKLFQSKGIIAGYQWTFSLDDALRALGVTPFITGTNWYAGMFYPGPTGRVVPSGRVEGGHEYVADAVDVDQEQVWFTNSWGTGWGVGGRFWMSFDDYGRLLAEQGDVTIFTPVTEPAPVPDPPVRDPADVTFAAVLRPWAARRHAGCNRDAAKAAKAWLAAKGLSV